VDREGGGKTPFPRPLPHSPGDGASFLFPVSWSGSPGPFWRLWVGVVGAVRAAAAEQLVLSTFP